MFLSRCTEVQAAGNSKKNLYGFRLGPHPARARTLRRLPRPTSTQRISSLSRRRPTTRTFTPFYFAREEHCTTWTAPRRSPVATTTTTTHSEVLGCALYLLTTTAIPRTGPVWARGFCPGSRRPRARVPLVVWAWDLLLCGFFAAVSRPPPVASFSLCDLRLFVIKRIYPSAPEKFSHGE